MRTFQIATLVTSLFVGAAQAASNPVHYNTGLGRTSKAYYKVGGDRVKFDYRMASGCDQESLRNAALKVKNSTYTFAYDDAWYVMSVPQGSCMVIAWFDLDTGKFGWAGIQNRPSSWRVRGNASGWVNLGNGDKQKYSYTINGQTVDLDIFNPYNQGTVSGNDIFFGFGY